MTVISNKNKKQIVKSTRWFNTNCVYLIDFNEQNVWKVKILIGKLSDRQNVMTRNWTIYSIHTHGCSSYYTLSKNWQNLMWNFMRFLQSTTLYSILIQLLKDDRKAHHCVLHRNVFYIDWINRLTWGNGTGCNSEECTSLLL